MKRVLVTGASGFIGRQLCADLAAAGWQVRAGLRPGNQVRETPAGEPVCAELDALDMSGLDCVFHLAGLAHGGVRGTDRAALQAVNCEATVSLFRRALDAGVGRFVWLSSIKVLGDVSAEPLPVHAPYRPGDAYAESKVAGEQALLAAASQAPGNALAIVRPPLVYGPGVKANFLSLLRAALGPWPLPLARAQAKRAWVSLANLTDLLRRVAEAPALSAHVWHVRDQEESSVADMVAQLRAINGRAPGLLSCPPGVGLGVAGLFGRRAQAERLFLPLRVDQSGTESALQWRPRVPQQQALEEVLAWHQAQH